MAAVPRVQPKPRAADLILLATAGASALLVYGAILLRLPLLLYYTLQLKNLNNMPSTDQATGLLIVGCIVLLFASYAAGIHSLTSIDQPSRARAMVLGFPIAFVIVLALVFPITSTDIYDYLFRGRILAHYGANPFVAAPSRFSSDPLLPYVAWKEAVTAYGPLWEYLSGCLAWLLGETPAAPENVHSLLLRYIIGYKLLAIGGYLLCGAAIWAALGGAARKHRWAGLYLWLWNPLVVWETAAAGHNDAWMVLFVVVAIGMFRLGQAKQARQGLLGSGVRALLALTAGGLIKFVAFFFGPVMLAATVRRLPDRMQRWRLLGTGAIVCGALMFLAYLPFWSGGAALQNIGNRRTMFSGSWIAALRALLALHVPADSAETIAAGLGLLLLLFGIGWASWNAWRAPSTVTRQLFWLAIWFLVVCNPWFEPWYAVWVVALAALMPWRAQTVLSAGLFSCTALMSYIVDGLILPAFGLADGSFWRELLLAAFLYVPPVLVLLLPARNPSGRSKRAKAAIAHHRDAENAEIV